MQRDFLFVDKGEPYKKGSIIQLQAKEILLGRSWKTNIPDISFSSLYISKRHALISFKNNNFTITDLGSKHGTQVNNSIIKSNQFYVLKHGDRISLARKEVVLIFNHVYEGEPGETVDFTCPCTNQIEPRHDLVINLDRREILIEGKAIQISGKELELLLFLYQERHKAISYNDIKVKIWPERLWGAETGIPDVGNDEITALVYRLRKRLGKQGQRIVTIPRFGYMLDL